MLAAIVSCAPRLTSPLYCAFPSAVVLFNSTIRLWQEGSFLALNWHNIFSVILVLFEWAQFTALACIISPTGSAFDRTYVCE